MYSSAPPALSAPTRFERWVSDGGWLVNLLMPSTDAGVAVQAVVLGLVFAVLSFPPDASA